jgi:hypothetical protein
MTVLQENLRVDQRESKEGNAVVLQGRKGLKT